MAGLKGRPRGVESCPVQRLSGERGEGAGSRGVLNMYVLRPSRTIHGIVDFVSLRMPAGGGPPPHVTPLIPRFWALGPCGEAGSAGDYRDRADGAGGRRFWRCQLC